MFSHPRAIVKYSVYIISTSNLMAVEPYTYNKLNALRQIPLLAELARFVASIIQKLMPLINNSALKGSLHNESTTDRTAYYFTWVSP
ncbi:hypothetical protein SAMN03159453_00217 [Pseudomonas sp. NFIX28]|nr:hypothetical protein SAMN03159453_00217 [Pseudomonas sp. NFIX28]